MSPGKRKSPLVIVSLAVLLALSCRLVSEGMGAAQLASPTPPSEPSLTLRPTDTPIPPSEYGLTATYIAYPGPLGDADQPPLDTPTPVIIDLTATWVAYPGPLESATQEPSPRPEGTTTSTPDAAALTQTVQSLMQTLQAMETATPITPTPSATPVFVPTFTPTLPGLINLDGLWYGYRKIEIQYRDCEESTFHSLRWRIEQDSNYNLLVNDDLSGYLKGNVAVLSGIEYFEGGTLDLTYILTVGPTVHRLSGYMYGKARLPDVCGRKNITQVNVPGGSIDIER